MNKGGNNRSKTTAVASKSLLGKDGQATDKQPSLKVCRARLQEGTGLLKVLDTGTVLTLKPYPCPGCKVPPVIGYEL